MGYLTQLDKAFLSKKLSAQPLQVGGARRVVLSVRDAAAVTGLTGLSSQNHLPVLKTYQEVGVCATDLRCHHMDNPLPSSSGGPYPHNCNESSFGSRLSSPWVCDNVFSSYIHGLGTAEEGDNGKV